MATNSEIGWTHDTRNFWWGCTEVHAGCDNCYAKVWDKRMGGNHWGARGVRRAIKEVWDGLAKSQKLAEKEGINRRVFVGSMMDIFERSRPAVNLKGEMIGKETGDLRHMFFQRVKDGFYPNLIFLLLTKRPQNITRMIPPEWLENPPPNVMYGTSVSNQESADSMIHHLVKVPGRHFLSVEPLLGPVNLELSGRNYGRDFETWSERVDWVICGGESGRGARPMEESWAEDVALQCYDSQTPFFMKQMGGTTDKRERWFDLPPAIRVRDVPVALHPQPIFEPLYS